MSSLRHHFLIAMPSLGDPNFNGTVTYLCKHDAEGAFGLVINRPLNMQAAEVFQQLELDVVDTAQAEQAVLGGGPVQPSLGFVLHQSPVSFDSTLDADAQIKVTISRDILESMASGRGPSPAVITLGYAGWDAGQLESELAANAWLSVPADPAIIFDTPIEQRWSAAAGLLGVDVAHLTNYAGHA